MEACENHKTILLAAAAAAATAAAAAAAQTEKANEQGENDIKGERGKGERKGQSRRATCAILKLVIFFFPQLRHIFKLSKSRMKCDNI